jgi:hypothetical protein
MTFREFKEYLEYELHENCITDKFFFRDFSRFVAQMRIELHNKNLDTSFNEKQKTYDIVAAKGLSPGEYGYMGRYDLPDDLLSLTSIFLNNGKCTEPIELDTAGDTLPMNCSCIKPCGCVSECAKPKISMVNGFLQIAPLPKKNINMGLIIKYEADYKSFTVDDMDKDVGLCPQDEEYVLALMIRHMLFKDATEYSEIQVKRFAGIFQDSLKAFHLKHGIGGVKKIGSKKGPRPFGRTHNTTNR